MAAQIRRDLYADVTSRKRPAEAMQSLDWPHHNQTDEEWLWPLAAYHTTGSM
jgi:hypothetical protein